MKHAGRFWSSSNVARTVAMLLFALTLGTTTVFAASVVQGESEGEILSMNHPEVQRVMKVQNRYNDVLMKMNGVVCVATGRNDEGEVCIVIFTREEVEAEAFPERIEDVPVELRVMGEVVPATRNEMTAFATMNSSANVLGTLQATNSPTSRLQRPVPIGTSISNWHECGAGTLGVRLRRGDEYFVLSCNHVFARLNAASPGELLLQPGRADVGCAQTLEDTIGRVADFQPISYTSLNIMDAAIARTSPDLVSFSTPTNGYGIPSSTTITAAIDMPVQKYGRTTGLTTGTISGVNATVAINYPAGTAYFVGQILISSSNKKAFVDGGDSGSLVVTNNANKNPVGLIFAKSGNYGYASPIDWILDQFDAQIDDGSATPLPVELTSFSGRLTGENVTLRWETATELNSYGFFVQRSRDKTTWEDIAFLPGAGNSNSPRHYNHVDAGVATRHGGATLYYRLHQVDRDGSEEYSSVLELLMRPMSAEMNVFPHPIRSEATIQLHTNEAAEGMLYVYNAYGMRLEQFTRSVSTHGGVQLLPLSFSDVAPGSYFLEYRNARGVLRRHVLVMR